jgi:hypothetical protein
VASGNQVGPARFVLASTTMTMPLDQMMVNPDWFTPRCSVKLPIPRQLAITSFNYRGRMAPVESCGNPNEWRSWYWNWPDAVGTTKPKPSSNRRIVNVQWDSLCEVLNFIYLLVGMLAFRR